MTHAVMVKAKSIVQEYIDKGIAARRKAKYNAKRKRLWVTHPEAMCAMEAANLMEHLLDKKLYGPFDHYMCITAKHSKVDMEVHAGVRDRLISIVSMEIYPKATLYSYLADQGKVPGSMYGASEEFTTLLGVPFYRELIKKIRRVHGFIEYLKPYQD